MWNYCKNKDFQQKSLVAYLKQKNVALCTATHSSGKS